MNSDKSVLVIGTGTIGEPLIGLLCDIKDQVGIDEVLFHKYTPPTLIEDDGKDKRKDRPLVRQLIKRGAKLCIKGEKTREGFEREGFEPFIVGTEEAVDRASVVIDCTPRGFGHRNKLEYYKHFEDNTLGFIAQGSETGFGKPYVYGVSDSAISGSILEPDEEKYLQVLSCNTHNLVVLIYTLSFDDEGIFLPEWARFVCIRRANDISQTSDFVPAPTLSLHDDHQFGTHHAHDANRLFETLGYNLNLFSSAMKVNTQYMHSVWFDIKLNYPLSRNEVMDRFVKNPRISLTWKDNTSQAFSFGRDHGHYGRILNNTIVVVPTLAVDESKREIIGFCFTPQDGNSLLSSVGACLWFLYPDDYKDRMEKATRSYLFQEV